LPVAFTPDARAVLFSAQRLETPAHVQFPARGASELYRVSVEGGKRPTQVLTSSALSGQLNKAGTQLVYKDWKGVESPWRKHHVSPVARDIWLYDLKTGSHWQLSSFGGEDRNPVCSPDEQSVFFLSIAANGTPNFGDDGELYTLSPGGTQATQATRVVMPGEMGYSCSDGDEWFEWSPDGQSLLAGFFDRNRWSAEVSLFDAVGKAPMLNLTHRGYEDTRPVFARSGHAMMWRSDRMGLRGASGNALSDLFAMFFTRADFDRFNLDKAEFAQLKARG